MALRRICPICNGEGTDVFCRYTGYKYYGNVEDMLGMFLACEIYEAIDQAEYTDLTGNQEKDCDDILSLGFVSLYGESRAKAKLWTLFGEGTTTRANLEALISLIEVPEAPES